MSILLFLLMALAAARDVVINRNDEHACVHHIPEKDIREFYPDCFDIVRANERLQAVVVEFSGLAECNGDEVFKETIAKAVSEHCEDETCIAVKPSNVVLLSIERNRAEFVVTQQGAPIQLHNKYVIDSKFIVRILVQAKMDNIRIQRCTVVDKSYTTEIPILPKNMKQNSTNTFAYVATGLGIASFISSAAVVYRNMKSQNIG